MSVAASPEGRRARFDPVPGAHRPHHGRVGLVAIGALALLLIIAFGGWRPWAGGGQQVRAEFASADQLVPGRTPVRVAGVKVGTVERVDRSNDGRASIVVMALTDDDVRVARDAAAHIRLRTVLAGTRYIDLEPGSPTAPALGDTVIPAARTTAQTDWDDVTQILDPEVRRGQRDTLRGLRAGLGDPGAAARTLETLGPMLDVVGRGAGALRGEQAGDLQRLVAATAGTLDGLSRERDALVGLVRNGARTLGVTDEHRRALGEAVALSPRALDATRTTSLRLDRTLALLDPLVEDLRPGARAIAPATRLLRPALVETESLLRAVRPLVRDLPPALRALAAASRQGVPLLNGLTPIVTRTRDEILPWLGGRDEDSKLRLYEAIGPMFSVLSSAAGDFDGQGRFLHFPVTPTGDTVLLPCAPDVKPGELKENCRILQDALKRVAKQEARR